MEKDTYIFKYKMNNDETIGEIKRLHNRILEKVAVQSYASTFVLKIANFANPHTYICRYFMRYGF